REFWVQQLSLQAQYLDAIAASGRGSGTPFDSIDDWNVSLNASLPIYSGNSRRSALNRSRIQVRQLALSDAATRQGIEQSIRAAMHAAQASYVNIELSEIGAEASRKNLELVSEAYKQGTLSILDLLDAQNQSLQADLNASNAVHDFLLNIMSYQRATSTFEFLLGPTDKRASRDEFFQYIKEREADDRPTLGESP
ncbi:MAG: TolC family protein, partial [Pseudomonadota bacterium]